MAIDHSLTYTKFRFKNIPHRARLSSIKRVVDKYVRGKGTTYADVGCSNGYLTDLIAKHVSASSTVGFDFSDNLNVAREKYPSCQFSFIDLNKPIIDADRFKLVTCFETLEHVGNTDMAIDNLTKMVDTDGVLIISVPIEIGFWGLSKYLLKRFVYRYSWALNCTDGVYFKALLTGADISQFRIKSDGYGNHFGFDYRIIDRKLKTLPKQFQLTAWNEFTTRFYVLQNNSSAA